MINELKNLIVGKWVGFEKIFEKCSFYNGQVVVIVYEVM